MRLARGSGESKAPEGPGAEALAEAGLRLPAAALPAEQGIRDIAADAAARAEAGRMLEPAAGAGGAALGERSGAARAVEAAPAVIVPAAACMLRGAPGWGLGRDDTLVVCLWGCGMPEVVLGWRGWDCLLGSCF